MEVLRARSGEIAGEGAEGMRSVLREEIRKSLERPLAPCSVLRPAVGGVRRGSERRGQDHHHRQARRGLEGGGPHPS